MLGAIGPLRPLDNSSSSSLHAASGSPALRASGEGDDSSSRDSGDGRKRLTAMFRRSASVTGRTSSSGDGGKKREELQAALVRIQNKKAEKGPGAGTLPATGARVEIPAPNITAEDLRDPIFTGYLSKQGGSHKNWKRRWFVLQDLVLYYFPSPKGTKAKGAIVLPSYNLWIATDLRKKFAFKAQHVSARTYYFVADSYDEMKTWMTHLHRATQGLSNAATKALVLGDAASSSSRGQSNATASDEDDD